MQKILTPTNHYDVYMKDLFHPDFLYKLIKDLTEQLGTPSIIVTASQFAKRYAYHIVVPWLHTFSTSRLIVSISPTDCLRLKIDHDHFSLHMLSNFLVQKERKPRSVIEAQNLLLQHLFASHLTPLWNTLSEVTSVQRDLLWENTFIYISWLYQKLLAKEAQAKEDFRYISQIATGSCFHLQDNPFRDFINSNIRRKKCCLYFALPKADKHCRNCPLVCLE